LAISDSIQKNVPYYLNVNVEDEAGNVSAIKNLFTYIYNGEIPVVQDKPDIIISNRDIVIDNTPGKDGVIPGSIVKYTIKINNKGAGNAYNVEIKDAVPANTSCVIGSMLSSIPAVTEYWDNLLNGGEGAWTSEPDQYSSQLAQVRWVFNDSFKAGTEANISYAVKINQ